MSTILHPARLENAKQAFATRRVSKAQLRGLDTIPPGLRAGDLVLARVTRLGQHQRIELTTGRRAALSIGDEIIVACGARYAPDQFHAALAEQPGPANLVAAGGIAGITLARHSRMKNATDIDIIGRFSDHMGRPVNLVDYAMAPVAEPATVPIVAVVGTSMNAGKTMTCAKLVRGFDAIGARPAYIKATGTGSGGDLWALRDAGATVAYDFTDAGYATTYHAQTEVLCRRVFDLVGHAARAGCGVVVMEIADGVLQPETARMMQDEAVVQRLAGTVLAATDSIGAVAAAEWLSEHGHTVLAVTGAFTQSPLAMQEADGRLGFASITTSALGQYETAADLARRLGLGPAREAGVQVAVA